MWQKLCCTNYLLGDKCVQHMYLCMSSRVNFTHLGLFCSFFQSFAWNPWSGCYRMGPSRWSVVWGYGYVLCYFSSKCNLQLKPLPLVLQPCCSLSTSCVCLHCTASCLSWWRWPVPPPSTWLCWRPTSSAFFAAYSSSTTGWATVQPSWCHWRLFVVVKTLAWLQPKKQAQSVDEKSHPAPAGPGINY